MTDLITPPDDWPLDRNPDHLEQKLGPFDDYGDWHQTRNDELADRLGEDGVRLLRRLGTIESLLSDYDLTPDEAARALEYELDVYKNGRENASVSETA